MAIVPDSGEQWIAGLIRAQTGLHLALGTGTTAEAETQTALITELSGSGYARIPDATGAGSGDTATFQGIFPANNPTNGPTIGEYGLFTALTVGTLIVRHVEASPFVKATGDSLDLTISVQLT